MICPKCKTEVSENDVFCPNCKLRLIFTCPSCKSPTRLGPSVCPKCGFSFIKFCPDCGAKNFSWSSTCRKCGSVFDADKILAREEKKSSKKVLDTQNLPKIQPEEKKKKPLFDLTNSAKETKIEGIKDDSDKPLLFYIDFINLDKIFEKYDKEEFKQKVIQNIKTTVKIVFSTACEFVNSHCVVLKFKYTKQTNILKIIEEFNNEFYKFNEILEKTLDCGLAYKFAISTIEEVKRNKGMNQLKYGIERDIIVSSGTYSKLSNELSLIKIAADSYKMVYLEQKPPQEQQEDEKYDKTMEKILENLEDNDSKIRALAVSAPCGAGKTHLMDNVCYQISKAKYKNTLLFHSRCSALTQISPYGLIQSFFVNLFECPVVLSHDFNIKYFEQVVLEKLGLEKIEEDKLETLANLVYPLKKDYFENILINKELTYTCLKDVFEYLKKKKRIIIAIDDFDLIDESSYGFIKYLVEQNYFKNDAKLLLTYKDKHSISVYFQTNKLDASQCLNISLRSFNTSESKIFIKKNLGEEPDVPNEILTQIAYNAQGNIAYIEQLLQYMFERKILFPQDKKIKFDKKYIDMEIPKTLEDCFKDRLEFLKNNAQNEYIFLNIASLLGDCLDFSILSKVFEINKDEYFALVMKLTKKGYLKRKYEDVYCFKNSLTWSYCYIKAKEEEIIKKYSLKLLTELNSRITTTPLICPILAQITGNKELAFSLWTQSLRPSCYIGDVNIYAMAQKQSLILLESVKLDDIEYIKNNICERLGKLVYLKNPQEAKDYLTNVIVDLEKNIEKMPEAKDVLVAKLIDISGYLTKSLYLTQDYTGVVEVVDNILKYFAIKDNQDKKYVHELKIALIKTRKLEALLNLGSWEEVAVLVNTEINPVLQKNLNIFIKHKWITTSQMVQIWFEANIILAQSYAQQGNPLAMELISQIEKELYKEKDSKADYLKIRLAYATAMANTVQGNFDESDLILQDIVTDFSYVIDSPALVNQWNVINLINKILRGDFDTIKNELFEASTIANNSGDEVAKNLIKTLLAYVLLKEKSYLKAIEIATAQMQFFSSKKIAFGALLAWYISAASTAYNKADMYCIEICEKAVKICENAQNNNVYFKVLFQELIAKSYFKLGDFENAKMYCELALANAKENDLDYLKLNLNNLKAEILREETNKQPQNKKKEYAQNVLKLYNRNMDLARKLNLSNQIKKIEKDITSFRAFCQLNRIMEEK